MVTKVGSKVHPRYKGFSEWHVEGISEITKPIEYVDSVQGSVEYAPKILNLRNSRGVKALWFAYWISTDKTMNKLKWGQGPPMLEESVLLELLKNAISQGFLSSKALKELRAIAGD
ncbi:hypothetical protein ACFLWX_01110 [Chloroflexota bacterium]